MPIKKKKKNCKEVLKDIQKFLDEENNEYITDEDVNLDEPDGEKSIYVSFYQYIVSNCLLIFACLLTLLCTSHYFYQCKLFPKIVLSLVFCLTIPIKISNFRSR